MKLVYVLLFLTGLTSCVTKVSTEKFSSVSITSVSNYHRDYTITAHRTNGLTVDIPTSDQIVKSVHLPFMDSGEITNLFYTLSAVYDCGRARRFPSDSGSFYIISILDSSRTLEATVDMTVCEQQVALLQLVAKSHLQESSDEDRKRGRTRRCS